MGDRFSLLYGDARIHNGSPILSINSGADNRKEYAMGSFEDEIDKFLADEKKRLAEQKLRDDEAQKESDQQRARTSRNLELVRDYVENTIRPALEALQKKLDGQAGRQVTITDHLGQHGLAIRIEGPGKLEFEYLVRVRTENLSLVGQATFKDERGITHRPRSEELVNQHSEAGMSGVTEGDITRYAWRAYSSSLA
jgi:hypothetical protein